MILRDAAQGFLLEGLPGITTSKSLVFARASQFVNGAILLLSNVWPRGLRDTFENNSNMEIPLLVEGRPGPSEYIIEYSANNLVFGKPLVGETSPKMCLPNIYHDHIKGNKHNSFFIQHQQSWNMTTLITINRQIETLKQSFICHSTLDM